MVSISDQQVSLNIQFGMGSYFATYIYGRMLFSYRRQLWLNLVGLSWICMDSLYVLGDFNCSFGSHEKSGVVYWLKVRVVISSQQWGIVTF